MEGSIALSTWSAVVFIRVFIPNSYGWEIWALVTVAVYSAPELAS